MLKHTLGKSDKAVIEFLLFWTFATRKEL